MNSTVYNKLVSCGVKTRPLKRVVIERHVLEELYYGKKMSLSQIADMYNRSPSLVLKKMKSLGIKTRDSSESNTIYPKKPFVGSNALKAYMIGFSLGDLNVKKPCKSSSYFMLKTSTTKRDQLDLIKDVFGVYGHFYYKRIGHGFFISCNMDKSFCFLYPKPEKIKQWILNSQRNFFAFLAGFTDAEGNIGVYCGRARYRIGSYDKTILLQIYEK